MIDIRWILEFLQNSIANEMYTELVRDSRGNLQPSLVCRQVPFSNRPNQETNAFFQARQFGTAAAELPKNTDKTFITDLPRHTIISSDIKNKNVGIIRLNPKTNKPNKAAIEKKIAYPRPSILL